MKNLFTYRLFFPLLLFATIACKKQSDQKEPVAVETVMGMNPVFNGAGELSFQEGTILIEKIKIEATRKEGDPVIYSRSFEDENGLLVSLDGRAAPEQLKFDFPRSIYTAIEVIIEVDDDESMILWGTYKPPNSNDVYRIQFLLEEEFRFRMDATEEVDLGKGNAPQLTIELNPLAWFRTVVAQAFVSASTYSVDNQQTVVISEDKNESIYDRVTKRLDKENNVLWQ